MASVQYCEAIPSTCLKPSLLILLTTHSPVKKQAVCYRETSRTDYPVALRHIHETRRPHSIILFEVRFPL
jgi:hypothetical protein